MADEKPKELKWQKYIFFSIYCESASLAWHLQLEGKDVILAQVNDLKSIGKKEVENSESKKRRLNMWEGILTKKVAETFIDEIAKYNNKDEYFVVFDFNTLWMFAEKAKKAGFKYGLFPNKLDYLLESDRNLAKQFVQENYPELKTAECFEYNSIDEAIEMINESEDFWALKGNNNCFSTVVPTTKNIEFAREEIIDVLNFHKSEAEKEGFVLEKQIRDGIEFCTERIYWNGKPVAHSIDLENKAMGGGNCSIKVGCAENLIISIPDDAPILLKAFSDATDKLASKHDGLYFIDANTILKDGELYFLEFCTRWGFDSTQTEVEMAGSVSNYFESIANGKTPFINKFGVGVRGLNLNTDENGVLLPNIQMRWEKEEEEHIFPFDVSKDEKTGKMIHNGYEWELLSVFTGSSDDLEYAVIRAYNALESFSFNEMYYRSFEDFMCRDYDGNILDRYHAIQALISSPESKEEPK